MELTKQELAKYIDHTNLKPGATRADVAALCAEAKEYGFASVCVNPCHVAFAARLLAGTDVAVCCVIGFPLGASTTAVKAYEAIDAVHKGATEIDMVINIGWAREGRWGELRAEIAAVVAAIRGRAKLKVILETCLLTDEQKVEACRAAVKGGENTTEAELESIIARVLDFEDIRFCPHGRPCVFRITKSELEKRFGRIGS